MTGQLDASLKTSRRDELLELHPVRLPSLRIAGENEDRLAEPVRAQQLARRLDDETLALPAGQPGGLQNHGLLLAHAPRRPQTAPGARGQSPRA